MKCYKLIYKSPMFGSVYCDDLFEESDNRVDLGPRGMYALYCRGNEVDSFLDSNIEELGEYVPDELKELVVQATFGKYDDDCCEMYFITEICVKQEPNDLQHRQIIDWITGQMSDGWGEGLEQREVFEETVYKKVPHFDKDTCTFEDDEERVYAHYYIHPWKSSDFYIELVDKEIADVDIPCEEPVVHCAICKLQENGGYEVRTLYKLSSVQSVIECIRNSGTCYDEEFTRWLENFGTLGQNVELYFVCVNQGIFTKFSTVLGVLDMQTQRARIFTLDTKYESLNVDEYMEEELKHFYTDLMTK